MNNNLNFHKDFTFCKITFFLKKEKKIQNKHVYNFTVKVYLSKIIIFLKHKSFIIFQIIF